MKKIMMMLAAAMLLTATTANAQFRKKDNNRVPDRFHMGIRGGVTSNTYTGENTSNIDPLVFPTGGFALDFQVAPIPIFVGFGLNYMNYGFTEKRVYGGDHSYDDAHSIHMPITVSYHINVAPNLFINPFIGDFVAYNFDTPDGVKEDFNYGIRFGCGINFGRLTFDVGYDLGLYNLGGEYYNGSRYVDGDLSTGTFFATIGFNWAGSR